MLPLKSRMTIRLTIAAAFSLWYLSVNILSLLWVHYRSGSSKSKQNRQCKLHGFVLGSSILASYYGIRCRFYTLALNIVSFGIGGSLLRFGVRSSFFLGLELTGPQVNRHLACSSSFLLFGEVMIRIIGIIALLLYCSPTGPPVEFAALSLLYGAEGSPFVFSVLRFPKMFRDGTMWRRMS